VSNNLINQLIVGNIGERINAINSLSDNINDISTDVRNTIQKILPSETNLSLRLNYLKLFDKILDVDFERLDFLIYEYVKKGFSVSEIKAIIKIIIKYLKRKKAAISSSKEITLNIINHVRKIRNQFIDFNLLEQLYDALFQIKNDQLIYFFYDIFLIGSKEEKIIAQKYLKSEKKINLSQFSKELSDEINQLTSEVLRNEPLSQRIEALEKLKEINLSNLKEFFIELLYIDSNELRKIAVEILTQPHYNENLEGILSKVIEKENNLDIFEAFVKNLAAFSSESAALELISLLHNNWPLEFRLIIINYLQTINLKIVEDALIAVLDDDAEKDIKLKSKILEILSEKISKEIGYKLKKISEEEENLTIREAAFDSVLSYLNNFKFSNTKKLHSYISSEEIKIEKIDQEELTAFAQVFSSSVEAEGIDVKEGVMSPTNDSVIKDIKISYPLEQPLIEFIDFENSVINDINRDISKKKNESQYKAIEANPNESLFIVAGPGSGKTTVITLKVLKFIFVDKIDPAKILVTTFTKKTAAELRSRILGWGDILRKSFQKMKKYQSFEEELEEIDFNRIITGTLDSIAEELLKVYREPGKAPPAIIEAFVANGLMLNYGLFNQGRHRSIELINFIKRISGRSYNLKIADICKTISDLRARFYHDQISLDKILKDEPEEGLQIAIEVIKDYEEQLTKRQILDFPKLERDFLEKLNSGKMDHFLNTIEFLLVDEYQDTNLLQEQIYFQIAKVLKKNNGSIVVVGDDDQSMYRFRGATVNLFHDFQNRIKNQLKIETTQLYLANNYRSSKKIVEFVNDYIELDSEYQNVRLTKDKAKIVFAREEEHVDFPVLGMFRNTLEELATDLAEFIRRIIEGEYNFEFNGKTYSIKINNEKGSLLDLAVLFSSPQEYSYANRERLPRLLRNNLAPINVFNPRGQKLENIHQVGVLCGLLLQCLDPFSEYQNSFDRLPDDIITVLNRWRNLAVYYSTQEITEGTRKSLLEFLSDWENRPLEWKGKITIVKLIYDLLAFIPNMQNNTEGLIYLEAILRTIEQSSIFGKFGSNIIFDHENKQLSTASIKEVFWNVLVPIASGTIEINEDLVDAFPTDKVNIMSIHQAKGLEFPLIIIDVGSEFNTDNRWQNFKRHPTTGTPAGLQEDEYREYSPLDKPNRSALNRAFDDLFRRYFVAYSRPQDVLLLVGLNSSRWGYGSHQNTIPNVATGWTRGERPDWKWQVGLRNLHHI